MVIQKSFKYRLYPNKKQREFFAKSFGCSRVIYNYFLDLQTKLYIEEQKHLSYADCCKELKNLKRNPDYLWLKEVNSQSLQQ